MGDTKEIKAKVTVEYDGAGVDQAKKDLGSLSDIVGGSLAESTDSANDALSSLDEQMSKSAESTSALTSSVSSLEKPLQRTSDGITSVSSALGEQQTAIENAGTAFESIQKPIEGTTSLLESASVPMVSVTQNAESMQKQMSVVNDGFVQMNQSLSQSVPMLPQFATNLHAVSEEFDPREFGLDVFNENMSVFQDAMSNPYPFQMVNQYLHETGQTWDDFNSSIGDGNAALLDQMAAMPVQANKAFGAMSDGAKNTGQTFVAAAGETEAFTKQWNNMADSLTGINKFGGVGTVPYGPEGIAEGGAGFSFGDMLSGVTNKLWAIAGPVMAVQMIGYTVGQVASGIYNMAALAEGPAAHSVGTFTGAIDVLGQHVQSAGEQFSESFGQGILPTLDAINNVAGQSSGSGFWDNVGGTLGTAAGILGDLGQIVGGGLVDLGSLGITLNPSNPVGNNWLQSGWEGLQNLWAYAMGQPEPYPTPGSSSTSVQIDLPAIQQSLTQSIAVMNAQANNPSYLAAQAYLQSQGGYAQLGQVAYDLSHTSGMTPFNYTSQAYQNSVLAMAAGMNDPALNIGLNRAYFNSFPYQTEPNTTVSCFPAGTLIFLASGIEKAIETLQIGDRVLAYDGTRQVTTTVLALIKPLPKRVYELLFDNGNMLTLTDSHPIMTEQGWKSLAPASTEKENPDLAVSTLQIGDCIHAIHGTCTLLSIEPRDIVQVYNLTVDAPHTFYASGILVHNKVTIAGQIMNNVADTTIPPTDLKNSTLIQSLASNFSGADLTHTFTASVNWQTSGDLTHTFLGVAGWVGQGLANTFTGVAGWIGQGLSNTFTGAASWIGQGLANTFTGAASWIGQGLVNTFNGVALWIGQGLNNTFTGVADWIGENLEHTFTAVASWVGQGLQQTFTSITSTLPGFASGVENFSGGLAVVGERGPELAYLPQGTSIYPQTDGFSSLSSMMGGNASATSGDVHIHVQVGSKEIAHEILPDIAPMLRRYFGVKQ